MPNYLPSRDKPRSLYAAIFLAAGLYVLISQFAYVGPILLSFLLILLISLAVNPLVARLRNFLGRRSLGTAVLAFAFFFLVGVALWVSYAPVSRSASKLMSRVPEYWERVEQPLRNLERHMTKPVPGTKEPAAPPAQERAFRFDRAELISSITHALQALISNTAGTVLVIVTVFVGVVFTLLNPGPVFAALFGCIPKNHHAVAQRIALRIAQFVPRWAWAMLIGMAVVGALVFLATWPIFGLQDALVLGIIATLFEAIPYVGPILAGLPALLLAISEGGSAPLWVIIAYVSIQLLEHNVISTVIVAGRLRQNPVAVIFSVLFCVTLFGVLGVLLAVPLVATCNIVYDEIYRPRFLPGVSDEDLARMSRHTLSGNASAHYLDMAKDAEKAAGQDAEEELETPIQKRGGFGE